MATIHLRPPLLTAWCSLPGRRGEDVPCACARAFPIRPCFRRGLPCHRCCHRRGELLPHRFTLTSPALTPMSRAKGRRGGLFSVALSLGLLRPDVIRHRFFVKSGLSSLPQRTEQPPSYPRGVCVARRAGCVNQMVRYRKQYALDRWFAETCGS